jgi:poly(3-hydroxybutyrate) depolymerase
VNTRRSGLEFLPILRHTQRTLAAALLGAASCLAACLEELVDATDAGPLQAEASVPAAAAPSPASACAGKRGPSGERQRQIVSDGQTRTFTSYIPAALDPTRPAPLVLIFHGAQMSAASIRDLTGFEQLADEKGFIALFGDGDTLLTWNIRPPDTEVCGIGELFTNPGADDFRFVDDMIADVEQSHCVDHDHIFATGFSMGGYFTNHLACQRPELLRAAAPHSSGSYAGACNGKVPMLMIHGTGDPAVELECALATRTRWIERNGCGAQFEREEIEHGHCERHVACPERGQVTLCLLDDMCHAWSGRGTGALLCVWDFGSGPDYEDATALIWRFFEAHW